MRSKKCGVSFFAALLIAGLVLSACGGGTESDNAAIAAEPDEAVVQEDPVSNAEGNDGLLVLPTASGGQLVFNDLVGAPALLWFWAPW